MVKLDKNMAFIEINELFNSIANENMDNGVRLEKLQSILKRLQDDSYELGINRGLSEGVRIITEHAIEVKLKKRNI